MSRPTTRTLGCPPEHAREWTICADCVLEVLRDIAKDGRIGFLLAEYHRDRLVTERNKINRFISGGSNK